MEDKIFDIVTDLIRDDISKEQAIDKLLILHSVMLSFMDWLKENEPWLVNHGGKLNIHEIEQRYSKYINEA